jgi:hypothetical protein
MDNLLLYAMALGIGVFGLAAFGLACAAVYGVCVAFATVLRRD